MECNTDSTEAKKSNDRNLAKEALKECEQKFRILLETIQEGVAIHDRFKIIDANQGYAAMFGYGHHEMIGRDVLEFADPQSRDIVMNKLLKGDETPFKITALRKDGSTFSAELCSRIIPHRDNNLHLTVFRSLSASILVAPEEDIVKERLDPFFDYSPEAYYLADAAGKFIDVNKAAMELFGLGKADIIGKSFLKLNLFSSDQIPKAAKHLAFNIFGKPTEPEEYVIHRTDGSQVPVEISAVPIRINGKTQLFGLVRNIAEKKKAEAAMHRAIKEIEILVEERRTQEERQQGQKIKKEPGPGGSNP
jgi:PAS domain S-box-containing protein